MTDAGDTRNHHTHKDSTPTQEKQVMQHPDDLVEQINADLCYIMRTASRAEEQEDVTTLAEIQAVLALAMAELSSRLML
jgi:hypothetical protein